MPCPSSIRHAAAARPRAASVPLPTRAPGSKRRTSAAVRAGVAGLPLQWLAVTVSLAPSEVRARALVADPRFPRRYEPILLDFIGAYRRALIEGGLDPGTYDPLLCGMLDRLAEQLERPFVFAPYHEQITAPFDYYHFGREFLRPLVDPSRSSVRGLDQLDRIADQVRARDNVVFFANHQTEGDPQAISLLLEPTHPSIGQHLIFVAGERVTTDPLAVPFSMGCNLLCIYSKRYIDHPPEQRAAKQHHNKRTMERMSELLAGGGRCIYVAPSGGRDRPNAAGIVEVAPFDPQSIEMFVLMAARSGRPTHFYPMALATYAFLPPPETIQVELGEPRAIRRTGIHLAIGEEIDLTTLSAGMDRREARVQRAAEIWQRVRDAYAQFGPASPAGPAL